jgi:hypothetical protein
MKTRTNLSFERFPDPWEVSVNAYERFWEIARPYLSADQGAPLIVTPEQLLFPIYLSAVLKRRVGAADCRWSTR